MILRLIRGQLPGLVDTDLSIVDIDDCARGHLLAAQHGVAGERYLLNSFTWSRARDTASGHLETSGGDNSRVNMANLDATSGYRGSGAQAVCDRAMRQ